RTGDEVGALLEEIAGASKARDAAYDILTRAGRVDTAVDRFLITAGVDPEFPAAMIEEAERLPPYVEIESRADYREAFLFTIDDEDTREVDDALSVVERDGEIVIGVHIADVSAFVQKGDLLDAEA